jgi:hypothetical protein
MTWSRGTPCVLVHPGNGRRPGRVYLDRFGLVGLCCQTVVFKRPKSRNEDFVKHGAEVIKRVRERKPEVYLASVVSLLPKQSQIERRSPFDDVSDEEFGSVAVTQFHRNVWRKAANCRWASNPLACGERDDVIASSIEERIADYYERIRPSPVELGKGLIDLAFVTCGRVRDRAIGAQLARRQLSAL